MKIKISSDKSELDKNLSFDYNKNLSLLENLKNHKIDIKSSCGGFGKCLDCRVKITSSTELPGLSLLETQGLGNVFFITKERLACQLKNIDNSQEELVIEILNKIDN